MALIDRSWSGVHGFARALGTVGLATALACGGDDGGSTASTTTDAGTTDATGSTAGGSDGSSSESDGSGSESDGSSGATDPTTGEPTSEPTTDAPTTDATTVEPTTDATTDATTDTTTGGFDPDDPGVQLCGLDYPMDLVTIDAAVINGDDLELMIGYGGGCEEHDFGLCWDGLFLESNPVQAGVTLAHDGHGDACEAYLMEMITIDLSPLKAAWIDAYNQDSGTILVNLGGYGQLPYDF
ncbi:MAG: hypothetical protein KC636_29875 [Myxococcales bacterium]|nr:hypothetical protein [Myxococcales bacterium]